LIWDVYEEFVKKESCDFCLNTIDSIFLRKMARIFVIEDNEGLREVVTSYLELNDHEVIEFERTEGVLKALAAKEPDLVVLDVMLPDGNGFQLARQIREKHEVPILFLTAKTSESDRITGFEVGGDDYMVKPFSPKELSLRVEAILRRTRSKARQLSGGKWVLEDHVLECSQESHRANLDGEEISLTAAEWKILTYLASQTGVVIDRNRLLGESLDYFMAEGSERTIDTHIKNLRAKLGNSKWIETVRGFGYRFAGKPV
jgi:two-component system phosphate regulon response regulator PhoB